MRYSYYPGCSLHATGIAYVYTMAKGVELYAASQEFDSDDNDADEDFVLFGTRVKF